VRTERRLAGLACGALLALWLVACASPARAQVFAEELRVKGFWPDIALAVGGGIALDHTLDANVMGRLGVGALYAFEPLIVNLRISGEVGASAERGFGAELEINHFGGPFLQFGFDRVLRDDYMTRVMIGFTLFGVEWQHRLDTPAHNALLFVLRAPLGIWWFLLTHQPESNAPPPKS
jgi:hypothetical protein